MYFSILLPFRLVRFMMDGIDGTTMKDKPKDDDVIRFLIETADRRGALENQRALAFARFQEHCRYAENGGIFELSPRFFVEVSDTIRQMADHETDIIILDSRNVPIQINQPGLFLDDCREKYQSAIRLYWAEYRRYETALVDEITI